MNGAAASDLVLALVCGWLVVTRMAKHPGLGLAALLIGLAATLGVVRFSGLEMLAGPHRFASLVSAVAAFPLLAWVLRWPDDPVATSFAGASRVALFAGGIGIAVTVFGNAGWSPGVALASAVLIAVTMVQRRSLGGMAGAAAMIIGMGAAAARAMVPFDATVVLHLGLAAALVLLASAPVLPQPALVE
jgi:hypothetical protein